MKRASGASSIGAPVLALGAIVMFAFALVACGGDDGGGKKAARTTRTSTTTTTSGTATTTVADGGGGGGGGPASGPSIASFNVPTSVTCSTATTINISWSTVNATEVVISIDGPGPYRTYSGPSGSDSVPFACDGNPHTYMITAKGNGGQATRTVTVTRASSTATTQGTSTTT